MSPFPGEDRVDEMARRAAALVFDGRSRDLDEAIRSLGVGGSPRVRKQAARHLGAMRAVEAGREPGRAEWHDAIGAALAIMEAIEDLEERTADRGHCYRGIFLAGRIVGGHQLPEEAIHLRHAGDRNADDLAIELEMLGGLDVRVVGVRTRFGVLRSIEGMLDGWACRIRRCPPGQVPVDTGHLLTARPTPLADLRAVRKLFESS